MQVKQHNFICNSRNVRRFISACSVPFRSAKKKNNSLRARCPSIFSAIAIEKPVQSSLIFVRLELFKSDNITRYLHNWVVLRLCVVFTIGVSPRACFKYSNWYYRLLI